MRPPEIFNKIIQRVETLKQIYIIVAAVVFSVASTMVIVSVMSIIFHGRITPDYLVTGAVTSFLVSLMLTYMLLRLFSELRERNERTLIAEDHYRKRFNQVYTLYAIVSALSRSDSLNQIFDETLNAIPGFTDVIGSSILLFDSDGIARFMAWRGISDDYRRAVEGHSPWQPDEPNPLPVVIEDIEKDASLKHLRSMILNEGIRSMVFVPLTAGGRLIGKLMLYYDMPHRFSEDDLRFFQSVASHMALGIERRMTEERLIEAIKILEQTKRASLNILEDLQKEVLNRRKVEEALKERTMQLEDLAGKLELRVREEVEKRMEKEQLLIHQSKLAAMGEMIGAIAHQWRQPLNALGLIVQDIKDAHEFGELTKDYIDRPVEKSMIQIKFMSKTIDDFRNFFMPDKQKTIFDVIKAVEEVISIIDAQLRHNYIDVKIDCGGMPQFPLDGYQSEFKQAILNIVNNAKDAIIEAKEKSIPTSDENGLIEVNAKKTGDKLIIRISDNGGGIPEDIIDRIFDPYFTTKEQAKGTGIGLYMSKVIIENNMGGRIYAENIKGGTRFTIELTRAEHP